MLLTENAQKALNAIKETGLGKFSAKTLSSKCGYTVSPQTLSALARKGILNKVEGTSPVEYTFIGEFEMKGDGVASVGNLANRYAQYKTLIVNKIVNTFGAESPKGYDCMATLSGKYIEITKYDINGQNFPKTVSIFLNKIVDDTQAFEQAWNDTMNFKLIIM